MSDPENLCEEYAKDSRIPCKYGVKCYQKNSSHHEKYKHPPKKEESRKRKLSETSENTSNKRKTPDILENVPDVPESSGSSDITITKKEKQEEEIKKTEDLGRLPDNFDVKEFIKSKFLFEMPPDFYKFWNFCRELNPNHPERALKDASLELIGPFDVLAGKFFGAPERPEADYLCHWRYYYDPPELQTVIKGDDKTGFHIGYFRDDPNEPPSLVVSNNAMENGILTKMGDNIFAAVCLYLEELKNKCDPFKKLSLEKILHRFKKKAESLELNLGRTTSKTRARQLKTVSKTMNTVGLVVPYNRKTQLGYRELAVDDKVLQKLLNNVQSATPELRDKYLSDLQPVLNNATIAIDECDFGTGIELGWDIIAHGVDCLNFTALRFLKQCYELLGSNAFAKIVDAHLNNRKKGCNLSIL